ncbi:HalOD1 output domain-containing protein [Halomarina pelagica]|uniref:HalOD1 output domain-containing protein n=1 Tax=Halomarina pelagica TaxID=2961599 RepID=UPI0020C44333|nr:HalOD1 output domain-containing protein [Halomarina sp. BND7]
MPSKDHDTFILRYDVEPGMRISTAVVEALTLVDDSPIVDLPPLTDAVDPDALNTLSESSGFGRFSFIYNGYEVTIEGGETVIITRGASDADTTE